MREMKNSGVAWIGSIPDSWEVKPIRHFLDERIEKNSNQQVKAILSLSAKEGVTLYNGENHSGNKPREDLSDYKIVRKNDIVANSMNILSGSVGLSDYLGVVSPVYYVYYNRDSNVNNLYYLYYLFQCKEFQRGLWGLGNGILVKESESGSLNTIRTRIPSKRLRMQLFPSCSKKEQDQIVIALDKNTKKIDILISNQEQQIEKLKQYKQSLITEVVTKGLNPDATMKDSGVKWIGMIPKHWIVKRTKFVANALEKGKGITKEEVISDGDIQCVRYGEIYTKYNQGFTDCVSRTNLEIIQPHQFFEHGDILFAGTGELVEEIGKNVVYLGNEKCLAGGDIIVMKHHQDPDFLNYALNSIYSQKQKSYGKAKLKVVHISADNIGNVKIALPPLDEQQRIATYLDDKCAKIDRLIAIKQEKINKLNDYKKSFIYEYVTGKREVC